MLLVSFLGYGGLASCALGGLLALTGLAKGRQARQLGAAVQVDSLAELKQLLALVPVLVAVTGRVLAPKPFRCEMSDNEAAIVEMREEKKSERRASANVWIGDTQLLRESVRETAWALVDGSRAELPVEAGRAAAGDWLQTSGDRLIPENPGGALRRLAEEFQGSRSVGVRQVERMLPVGTMLTAVGELGTAVEHPSEFQRAVRKGGKMLVLRQPRDGPFMLSRQPLPDVIASLQASSIACQQWAAMFAAVGTCMLAAAATQHALTWVRRRRLRARVEKALAERAAAAAVAGQPGGAGGRAAPQPGGAAGGGGGAADAAAEQAAPRGLCVVCLERPSDTVFTACGHMCACSQCSSGLRRCPICRSRGGPIRVYTP